jgi:hypothetical protein
MTTAKEPPTGPKPASFLKSVISRLKPQRHSEAPANKPSDKLADPTRIGVLSDEPERRTSLNSSASRCQFTFADGRQCRNPAKVYQQDELSPVRDKKVSSAHFCSQHSPKQRRGARRVSDASALEALCSDLTTTTSINRALAQTFLLMAQGRISRKDAVAFGYLSQLLLQSVSGVRAEYVAANGYRQWENKLKTSLMPDTDDDPGSSPGGDNTHSAVSYGNSDDAARTVIPSERSERGIPPKPFPVNNGSVDERPLAERIMGQPDYADILSRSLDMLDRKYDFTPEGRSEAQKLALELELMKPAPAKPAKDFFGQTVDLMRRFRDAEQQESGATSIPPALDYYGHPIKMHVASPAWANVQSPPSTQRESGHASVSEAPSLADAPTRASASVASAVPESEPSCAPSASDAAAFVAPPSRRHRKPRSHSSAPGSAPHSELHSPLPISATTAKPDSVGAPDDKHHEGHRTDWYAPPSWSNIRKPDPCPSRKEKLQRKLRGLSNSALRHLQHRNSRGL